MKKPNQKKKTGAGKSNTRSKDELETLGAQETKQVVGGTDKDDPHGFFDSGG